MQVCKVYCVGLTGFHFKIYLAKYLPLYRSVVHLFFQCRRRGQAEMDRAIVTIDYQVANFARSERKAFNKNDRNIPYGSIFYTIFNLHVTPL